MAGSSSRMARSKASTVAWAGPERWNTSVEPHQIITARAQPLSALKRRMSSRSASASSIRFAPVLRLGPSSRLTYAVSKTAGMGFTDCRKPRMGSRWVVRSSTPALTELS